MPARCRDSATLRQAAFDDVIADRNLHSGPDLDPPSLSPLGPRFPVLGPVPRPEEKRGARWPSLILKLNISD
jgi:hypothetical protein